MQVITGVERKKTFSTEKPPPSKKKSMTPSTWFLIASIGISCFVLWPLLYLLIEARLRQPQPETDRPAIKEQEYFNAVYNQPAEQPLTATQTQDIESKLRFVWNNVPTRFRKKYPRAQAFAVSSPPAQSSRFRIIPDPVDVHKSTGLVSYLRQYLWSSPRRDGLPGWGLALEPAVLTSEMLLPETWIEISDICEQPPRCVYPMCDNGGYWSYVTPGSGVFVNVGKTPLVVKNKIAGMHQVLTQELIHNKVASEAAAPALAWKHMEADLTHLGGGLDLLGAFRANLASIHKGERMKAVIFKTMESRTLGRGWSVWFSGVVSLVICSGLVLGFLIWGAVETSTGRGLSLPVLGAILASAGVGLVLLFLFAGFVFRDSIIKDFGFVTLDMAKKRLGATTIEILQLAAKGENKLAAGLASCNVYDLDLQCIARKQGYSTLILTEQASNSGAWTSRISDLVSLQILPGPLGTCQTRQNFAQGICGTYEFKQGPLTRNAKEKSSLGPDNVPSAACECCESVQMKCAACQNALSFDMCKKVNHPICLRVIPDAQPC